jgi:hypothetical protein
MCRWFVACAWVLASVLPASVLAERPPDIAGPWEVTIQAKGETVTQHWTLQQENAKITGTATGTHGDMPVSGTLAGARFVVTVTDGDTVYNVLAMLDGDVMDGRMTSDAGVQSAWHATRAK